MTFLSCTPPRWAQLLVIYFTHLLALTHRHVAIPLMENLMQSEKYGGLHATESQMGIFVACFMLPFAVMGMYYGYLGDRYSRKYIIMLALLGESLSIVATSFSNSVLLFAIGRGATGFFSSAFLIIGPTIVSDMYSEEQRTMALTLLATNGPIGVSLCFAAYGFLGPLIGWRNSLRIFGGASFFAMLLIALLVPEYERGQSDREALQSSFGRRPKLRETLKKTFNRDNDERPLISEPIPKTKSFRASFKRSVSTNVTQSTEQPALVPAVSDAHTSQRSLGESLKYLMSVKSFMAQVVGYVFIFCVTEAGMTWIMEYLRRHFIVGGQLEPCMNDFVMRGSVGGRNTTIGGHFLCDTGCSGLCDATKLLRKVQCGKCNSSILSTVFGVMSLLSGIVGALCGGFCTAVGISQAGIRPAGPLLCAFGCLIGGVAITLQLTVSAGYALTWVLCIVVFYGIGSCHGIIADNLPRIIIPEERSLASSVQNVTCRLIGGTFPPYLTGFIAEKMLAIGTAGLLTKHAITDADYFIVKRDALRSGLLCVPGYAFAAMLCWVICSLFFRGDEDARKEQMTLRSLMAPLSDDEWGD